MKHITFKLNSNFLFLHLHFQKLAFEEKRNGRVTKESNNLRDRYFDGPISQRRSSSTGG